MTSTPKQSAWLCGITMIALGISVAWMPFRAAKADDSISGSARDADTDEAIAGAWIFETERKPGSGADVMHVARTRTTRTDADGLFHFESRRRRFTLGRSYPPLYQFYHPSYGLVRARAREDGRTVTFRPSLRDAQLRQADAKAYCNAPARDEMAKKIVELACPPARPDRFPDGSPRASGALDERGRREGPWTFFREDGSIIARGEYRGGAAVGKWHFEVPNSASSSPDGIRFVE